MSTFSSDVTAGQDVQAQDPNNIRKDLFLGARVLEQIAGAAQVTLDFSDVTKGNIKTISVDQNIEVNFSGITKFPSVFFVRFVMDASGGWAITWASNNIKFPGKAVPTISNGPNEVTGLMFVATAADEYDCYFAGFGLGVPA